jgi:hypothetical protein
MPKKIVHRVLHTKRFTQKISHNEKKENLAHKELTYFFFAHRKHPQKMIMLS